MIVYINKKSGKGGLVAGCNLLTAERLSALAAASACLILTAVGLRASSSKPKQKKKRSLARSAMKFTLLYRIAKAVIGRVWLSGLVKKAAEHKSEICEQASAGDGVEVICAIPISSKEEVYDRIL